MVNRFSYTFNDNRWRKIAFTHTSYLNENRDVEGEDNERLELLGDSVLNLLVTEYLFNHRKGQSEGQLSFLRSRMVEASTCATFLKTLGVEEELMLGKGEKKNLAASGETLYANLFEALLGAIYMDGGFEVVKKFFWEHFRKAIDEIAKTPNRNWKADLQDKMQKKFKLSPTYQMLSAIGPEHSKQFHVAVLIGNKAIGEGVGHTKKEAEMQAAKQAWEAINGAD